MKINKISVIIPCYNEEKTISKVLDNVKACGLPTEVIVVDDASTDNSWQILRENKYRIDKLLRHRKNLGKGMALKHGIAVATGDVVIVQDADLEYDPKDFHKLIVPFEAEDADVVYGSRYLRTDCFKVDTFFHEYGNKLLTLLSNIFSDLSLSDMETCYKMFRREVIQKVKIEEKRFGFEPEVTAKISGHGYKIYEVPISYTPRGFAEGKKINFKDAIRALICIVKYNLVKK